MECLNIELGASMQVHIVVLALGTAMATFQGLNALLCAHPQ